MEIGKIQKNKLFLYKINFYKVGKGGKSKRSADGKKISRQSSEEDLLDSESLSVSRDEYLEDGASPRRRRKGVTDKPKYDTGYFDEDESVKEVSTRARRTRKGASDTIKPNLDRQTSKQSLDDLSRKDKDAGLKRRGTSKKLDIDKAKSAASRDTKEKKLSDVKGEDSDGKTVESDNKEEKDDDKLDEKNVVFCMWGHENCRTRSHYRYNWQWDYVQKYAEQNNKHLVHGFIPKEKDQPMSVRKMAQDAERAKEEKEKEEKQKEEDKKPGKEGIRSRMKLLQNKFSGGKASESVKQHIFERDLELEMLRRKKTYQQNNHQTGRN